MNIAVTGSSGFIGSELVRELLSRGHSVIGIDKSKGEFTTDVIDILDFYALKEAFIQFAPIAVYHLAADTTIDEGKTIDEYESNTIGTKNVVKACNLCPSIEYVFFASTIHVHRLGHTANDFLSYWPQSSYGESKVFGEQYLRQYLNANAVVFRLNSIWSEKVKCVYTSFLDLSSSGLIFRTYGCGVNITFGHLDNVISCFIKALSLESSDLINHPIYLGDYEPYNVNEWIRIISQQNNKRTLVVPLIILKFLGVLGDSLFKIGIRTPISSRRIENFTTNRIYELGRTRRLFGEQKVYYKEINYRQV